MKKSTSIRKWGTDFDRLDAMSDKDIDFSDLPEVTPEMFAKGVVQRGIKLRPAKAQLTLRLDRDVLEWFKHQGRGYQTKMNALLRAYMEESQAHDMRTKTSVRPAQSVRAKT